MRSKKTVPLILQSEAADCGLACITMIASFHGLESDIHSMKLQFPTSARGTGLKQLIEMGNRLNLGSRAIKVGIEDLEKVKTPCILHWDMAHFIVLERFRNGKAVIHDPAIGKRQLNLHQLGQHFTGIALEFFPTQDFEKKKLKKKLSSRSF